MGNCFPVSWIIRQRTLPIPNLSMASSSSSQSAPASYLPNPNHSMASSSSCSPSALASYLPNTNLSMASSSSSPSAPASSLPIPNHLMASLSSSSQSTPASYDVFLSFRGEDTRKTFVDHLYSALKQHAIHTYKDDETLPRGVSITPSLFKAIKRSRIAVIIFSKNYADSSWCLDELEYIMKCKDETGLIVMPVFYDVDPSDVRKQKGDFGKGFAKQEANNIPPKIKSWRKALVDASNHSGWEPKNVANGHESKVIKEIVDVIFDRLFSSDSEIDDGLVGMRTRLQEMIAQLEMGLGDVHMVGIWGIGGVGKTTLATSVYMKISHQFEGSCIVENIREESSKNGLKNLQEVILSSIFKTKVDVPSIIQGKKMIKTRLCHKKVLILLDDVDKLDQLQALVGSHKWFGGGSRIIITTRDEQLLRAHKVNQVYPVRLLSDDEAKLLFNIHAYDENNPVKDYEELSSHVISYASGLPLALKVLGSFLYNKDENEWMSALDRLKDIPEMEIVEKLKISYDGLNTVEKELFLDIACFLRGKYVDYEMEVLDAFGYHPCIGIKILREKALITITRDGKFDMHDQIQEMGHFIVRGENLDNPEKHSRVWKHEEISNMCFTENYKIEAIHANYYSPCLCMIVSNMKQLRWLSVGEKSSGKTSCNHDGGPSFLSNELRFIYWRKYPASPFPESFQPIKLVVIKLDNSLQEKLWMGYKHLPHLKRLHLRWMDNLLSTPDFRGLPCLQKFILHQCPKLEYIHPSLGNHSSLEYVEVSDCDKLRMFPTIVQMEKIEFLDISSCPAISEFPKIQANLESLVSLSLNETRIRVVPSEIGELSNLQELDLRFNKELTRIDFSLSQQLKLLELGLSGCESLVELPKLPSSLAILNANECKSVTSVGDCYKDCKSLCQVSLRHGSVVIDGGRLLESMLQGNAIDEDHCMLLRLQGLEIPKGFIPRLCKGRRCTLQLPNNWCDDFCGFLMCAVLERYGYRYHDIEISMKQAMMSEERMDSGQNDVVYWEEGDEDTETWVGYIPFGSLRHTSWWATHHTCNTLSFSICDDVDYLCSGFGVRLVSRNSSNARLTETTSTDSSSQLSDYYKPKFKILHDSASALTISLREW